MLIVAISMTRNIPLTVRYLHLIGENYIFKDNFLCFWMILTTESDIVLLSMYLTCLEERLTLRMAEIVCNI